MENECQKEFEAWYTKKYLGVNIGTALDKVSDGYAQLDTHFCWLGWQAAWNFRQEEIDSKDNAMMAMSDSLGILANQ